MNSMAVDLVISFDTTSSMHAILESARRDLGGILRRLFAIGGGIDLRVGLILHGDYGDLYETKLAQPTSQVSRLVKFLADAPNTCGLDYAECYELVLHQAATKVHWRNQPGVKRLLVLLGDAVPHAFNSRRNKYRLDWRQEARSLARKGVSVYGVDCGGIGTGFYGFASELCGMCDGATVPYRGNRALRSLLEELITGQERSVKTLENRYRSYHCDSQRAESSPTISTSYSLEATNNDHTSDQSSTSSASSTSGEHHQRSHWPESLSSRKALSPACAAYALVRNGSLALGKTVHWVGKALLYVGLLYLLCCFYAASC